MGVSWWGKDLCRKFLLSVLSMGSDNFLAAGGAA
jgi:hypothetical protein